MIYLKITEWAGFVMTVVTLVFSKVKPYVNSSIWQQEHSPQYIPVCISTGMWEKNFKFNGTVATLLQDKVVMIFKVLCRMSMRLVLQRTVGNFSYLTKKLFFYSQKVQRLKHRKVESYFSTNAIMLFENSSKQKMLFFNEYYPTF